MGQCGNHQRCILYQITFQLNADSAQPISQHIIQCKVYYSSINKVTIINTIDLIPMLYLDQRILPLDFGIAKSGKPCFQLFSVDGQVVPAGYYMFIKNVGSSVTVWILQKANEIGIFWQVWHTEILLQTIWTHLS